MKKPYTAEEWIEIVAGRILADPSTVERYQKFSKPQREKLEKQMGADWLEKAIEIAEKRRRDA
jgi:hypothetical protein